LCLICNYDLVAETELVSGLAQQAVGVGDLFYAGERILNLERMLNRRFGATGADDRLPDMFFDKEYNAGKQPSKPQEWMEPMIREFYAVMGWDENGRPTEKKLEQLELLPSQGLTDSAA
jgi:aldehyde:ferredoxin oxidoreductase